MAARSGKRTDITLWNHVELKQRLLAKPRTVLLYFKRCQIACLCDLALYLEIKAENPEKAAQIVKEAEKLGIPESCDVLIDDVLGGERGEV